ncbi:unnamed protein product [Parajaminaea phylloscopi]
MLSSASTEARAVRRGQFSKLVQHLAIVFVHAAKLEREWKEQDDANDRGVAVGQRGTNTEWDRQRHDGYVGRGRDDDGYVQRERNQLQNNGHEVVLHEGGKDEAVKHEGGKDEAAKHEGGKDEAAKHKGQIESADTAYPGNVSLYDHSNEESGALRQQPGSDAASKENDAAPCKPGTNVVDVAVRKHGRVGPCDDRATVRKAIEAQRDHLDYVATRPHKRLRTTDGGEEAAKPASPRPADPRGGEGPTQSPPDALPFYPPRTGPTTFTRAKPSSRQIGQITWECTVERATYRTNDRSSLEDGCDDACDDADDDDDEIDYE